jgi:hypothetical protein
VGTLFYAVNSLSMALITRAAEPGFPGLGRGRWRLSPCASAINDPARSLASMGMSFDKALISISNQAKRCLSCEYTTRPLGLQYATRRAVMNAVLLLHGITGSKVAEDLSLLKRS